MPKHNPRIEAGIRALEEEMRERYGEHGQNGGNGSEPSVLTPPEDKVYRSYEVPIFWKKTAKHLKLAGALLLLYFLFFPVSLSFPLNGKLIAREMRVIDSKLDGELVSVFKSGGEAVEEGEVIGRISSPALHGEKVRLEAEIAILQTELDGIQKSFEAGQRQFDTYKRLYEEGDLARLKFQDEEIKLKELENRFAVKEAEANERKIKLSNLEKKLEAEVIKSPITGVITSSIQEKLNSLFKEGEQIAEIAYGGMRFEFRVKEQAVRAIQIGQKVKIKLDAFPGKRIEGNVDDIRPIVIEDNPKPWEKVYNARILVSAHTPLPGEARVGMSAKSQILLKQRMSRFMMWFQNLF